jgi:hypothetical protein
MNTTSELGPLTHRASKPRTSAVPFCLLTKEARTKQGEHGALVVNGHISNPRYRLRQLPATPLAVRRRYFIVIPRPLPAAPLVAHRRYLIAVPKPLPCCASRVLDRGVKTAACCATQVLDRGVQAVARGAARCASQVHNRGAKAVAHDAARCLSQVLDRGAHAAARSAARCASQVLGRGARLVPAAPLVMCRRYLIVVPRPSPTAPRRFRSRRRTTQQICSGAK